MALVDTLIEADLAHTKRIVVVGDAMIDQWVYGRMAPCQDGCTKFVEERRFTSPGGADNAARCLENWCADVDLMAVRLADRPVKIRFVDVDECIQRTVFRHDRDDTLRCKKEELQRLHALALDAVQLADAVLISDYDKGFLTPEFVGWVVAVCKQRGVPCVADAKREPRFYCGALLKYNYVYGRTFGFPDGVCTHGAEPPAGVAARPIVECVNHVGAGDCFGAHLALALAHGFSLPDAVTVAHSAGRVYVQHPHNRPPRPEEISRDCG